MSKHVITVSRQDLFDKIWSMPLSELRHELGVSDVAIANACRRAKIPMPGKGYWQTSARSRPRPPELPFGGALREVVTFTPRVPKDPAEAVEVKAPPEPPITVPRSLRNPHALLEWMPEQLYNPWLPARCHLNMIVTEKSLNRASRIMDAFIKTTEREGWKWTGEYRKPTVVTVEGVDLQIKVRELRVVKKTRNPPGSYSEFSHPLEWSGDICITIDEWHGSGVQKRWRDTARHPLEATLRKVATGFRDSAVVIGKEREEWEEAHRTRKAEYEEERAVEQAQQRAQHLARRKQDGLWTLARRWRKVESLRRFLQLATDRVEKLPEGDRAAAMDWLSWAREEADANDPLHGDWIRLLSESE